MKIRNEFDRKVIEQMILQQEGVFTPDREANFIKRRKSIVDAATEHSKDARKKLNAIHNWKHNRRALEKGIKQYQISSAGKTTMRKLHRFNVRNNASGWKGMYTEDFTREDALKAVLSLQTHLIIESQYCIPDLETHISTRLLVENALEILEEVTHKIRVGEDLNQDELDFLKDLTI
jgi:hypothetical protein